MLRRIEAKAGWFIGWSHRVAHQVAVALRRLERWDGRCLAEALVVEQVREFIPSTGTAVIPVTTSGLHPELRSERQRTGVVISIASGGPYGNHIDRSSGARRCTHIQSRFGVTQGRPSRADRSSGYVGSTGVLDRAASAL